MSESANQARPVSTGPFVPTFPQSLRDTEQKPDEKRPVTVDDVFNLIRSHEPINRAQLSARLGIAPQGLNTFLSQLSGVDRIYKDADGYRARDADLAPVTRINIGIENPFTLPTRSLDEPTEHLFDAELTAALDLITKRVKQPVGIAPLANDDPRITAFRGLLPILADDIAQAVGEILDYVTGEAA